MLNAQQPGFLLPRVLYCDKIIEKEVTVVGRLLIWTYSHFAVDFGCFYILFAGLKTYLGGDLETLAAGFLAYNVIAFGLQSVLGLLGDERSQLAKGYGFAGACLVLLGVLMVAGGKGTRLVWADMVIAAFGNALFHVGGGVDVLRRSSGKMAGSGVFVSSGAMGVALGTLCSSGLTALLFILAAVLLTGLVRSLDIKDKKLAEYGLAAGPRAEYIHFNIAKEGSFLMLTGLLMAAVFIRSYAGSIMPLEWEKTGWLVIAPAAASCLGKALGGTVGDRFGAAETGVISLLISAPLICLGAESAVLSLAGILLFNMTMPITLCGLASLMQRNLGFAFGLTTLALLMGVGITYFLAMPAGMVKPVVAVMIVAAAVCIWMSIKRGEKRK